MVWGRLPRPTKRPMEGRPRVAQDTHEYRQVIYRLLPGSRAKARKLAATAGACRFVWNAMLDQQEQLVAAARLAGADRLPGVSFFTLGKTFTQLRRVTPWLQEMPFAPVRYTQVPGGCLAGVLLRARRTAPFQASGP